MIGDLSKRYESNGDAGCISNGYDDAGGKSYGMYQLSSNMGVVDDYIRWLRRNGYWFAENLAEHPVGSLAFDEAWRWLAYSNNKADFEKSQHDYICDAYYKPAVYLQDRSDRSGCARRLDRILLPRRLCEVQGFLGYVWQILSLPEGHQSGRRGSCHRFPGIK